MNLKRKAPRRSLRTILIIWFLLFSIVPLGFVTWYSIRKFEKAINNELAERLSGNVREFNIVFSDYLSLLQSKKEKYIKDANFLYHLNVTESSVLRSLTNHWIKQEISSSITIFNREGRMLVSAFRDEKSEIRNFIPNSGDAYFLSDKLISHLKSEKEYAYVELKEKQKISLILLSRVSASNGKIIGYIEQVLDLDKNFLYKLKSKMKLEVMILKSDGTFIIGSHPDFYLYKNDFFKQFFKNTKDTNFELNVRNDSYGFFIYPMDWGNSSFNIALGASKEGTRSLLKNINYAFATVLAAVILLLFVTIIITSNWVLKPLYELVDVLHSFEIQEQAITIPVKNDTEIGLLTESFNEMSKKIWQARNELKNKITELEKTNKELKDAQAKLVHSSKMISLGQLVAGVAHELNNPIGFIYSNMSHLREYSDKLIRLIKIAEANPNELEKFKNEFEFDYIIKDMPKLISSCEDGARRTKDIVIGLRNFSRLEDSKLKEIDIIESIETSLNLLHGELKNRIIVHKQYGYLPKVYCHASEVNQVFMNILSNAAQAIDGPGNIWINTSFHKGITNKDDRVIISIQDSGKGIDPKNLEKIFDPFFTTKGIGQGTGLGLSISYGIIQNHGGDIQVKSEVGVGTEFLISLPTYPTTISKKS